MRVTDEIIGLATRALKVRVPDPVRMGIRRNGPPDGWLTNFGRFAGVTGWPVANQWGDYGQHPGPGRTLPDAAWWLGQDSWNGADDACPDFEKWGGVGFDRGTDSVLPAVTRCQMSIVNSVVRTPWVFEKSGEVHDVPLWVRDPMLLGGAPGTDRGVLPMGDRMTGLSFWSTVLTHMIFWGRAVCVYSPNSKGEPTAGTFRLINPYLVERDKRDGFDDGWVLNPGADEPIRTGHDGRFKLSGTDWRLVVFRGMPPNDDEMMEGVLTRHWETMRLGAAVSQYTADTFSSGVPSGFLKVSTPNFDAEKADALREKWMASHGVGKREVAVLNAQVDYSPISINPTDAEADKLTRLSRSDVALAFNLDPVIVGEGASGLTYNNQSDRREDFVDFTASGWAGLLMETLSALLPFGQELRVNWGLFTSANFEAQVPIMAQAVESGLLSQREARQRMGLDPQIGAPPETMEG